MFYRLLFDGRFILSILNGTICVVGDKLVDLNSNSRIFKAFFDNVTHACIGLVAFLIVVMTLKTNLSINEKILLTFLCFLFSSLIDIDHFLAAKTWTLKVYQGFEE